MTACRWLAAFYLVLHQVQSLSNSGRKISRGKRRLLSLKSIITPVTAWQQELVDGARPLEPTPLSEAASELCRRGVVRINGVVDPKLCTSMKNKVKLVLSGEAWSKEPDKHYIPGTRIRFREAIDVGFADKRHDLLLPLLDPKVKRLLREAIASLEPTLNAASKQLLPQLWKTVSRCREGPLEMVELAALLSRPGSTHQNAHGDYRRFGPGDDAGPEQLAARQGKLPPRLVVFVALQDVPTAEHGATVFLPGTNTGHAHSILYEGPDLDGGPEALAARRGIISQTQGGTALVATLRCGDVLIYDASILHWGGANKVPGNDRAVLYFGCALSGAAGALEQDSGNGLADHTAVVPVELSGFCL